MEEVGAKENYDIFKNAIEEVHPSPKYNIDPKIKVGVKNV